VDLLITAARKPPHPEDLRIYSTGTKSHVKPATLFLREPSCPSW
jgi:hypothetical protein